MTDLASTAVNSMKMLQKDQTTSLAMLRDIQHTVHQQMNRATTQSRDERLETNKENQGVTEDFSGAPKTNTTKSELLAANGANPPHLELNAGNKLPLEEFTGNQVFPPC